MTSDRLLPDQAKSKLNLDLLTGQVVHTNHFSQRLAQKPYDILAVDYVIVNGCIIRPPEWDDDCMMWKYRLEGTDPDGRWIVVIFAIDESDNTYLVTTFSTDRPRRL